MSALVLASASSSRARMLQHAGISFDVVPAHVDEDSVKEALLAEGISFAGVADALAELKAVRVSHKIGGAIVLGGDQVLGFDGELVNKCESLEAARALLWRLRGRRHELFSAAVLAKDGAPIWRHTAKVSLSMREFSEAFLDDYLNRHGAELLRGVGCYRVEDDGLQFFERIDGDYFAVQGLPLLPLLMPLREHGVLTR